jgi:hypothetical protein
MPFRIRGLLPVHLQWVRTRELGADRMTSVVTAGHVRADRVVSLAAKGMEK